MKIACMLVALAFANAASAQTTYYINGWVNGVSGGQAQIGDGLPLPIQPNRTTGMGPIGTKAMFPAKLLINAEESARQQGAHDQTAAHYAYLTTQMARIAQQRAQEQVATTRIKAG
jgi:hypothetical protein